MVLTVSAVNVKCINPDRKEGTANTRRLFGDVVLRLPAALQPSFTLLRERLRDSTIMRF